MEFVIDLSKRQATRSYLGWSGNGLPASAARSFAARPRFARPQYTPDETITVAHVKL